MRRALVIGSGAREHALAWQLATEPGVERVVAAPGNVLMSDVADVHPEVKLGDHAGLVALALSSAADLVVIGPEAPLVEGMADRLTAAGVACFGPTAAAARLEGSKAFARSVCDAAGVPMAAGRSFEDVVPALDFAAELGMPVVVKADGLAAGKGVTVCATEQEAERAIREALIDGRFGLAGRKVIVEACLAGVEASVIALCDGERLALLPAARDHKRIGEGDTGANTGGMGAYSPLPDVDDDALATIGDAIVRPVLAEMAARGTPFRGALFCGLMLTADGPRVLEFNVRLGDPETQAILPRLAQPLSPLLLQCATGELDETGIVSVIDDATVALTLAAAGYPDGPRAGDLIGGIDEARAAGALVFGAGVARNPGGQLVTAGGRVLSVVGRGSDLAAAADAAHAAAARIDFVGKQVRGDIGRAAAVAIGTAA